MDIAEKVLSNQDRDGMLRRSLERIVQLYTDKSHFIYELLQNAEDAGAHRIRFVQYEDRLEVMHDGRPFTTENLQGLCDIGQSDKINGLNQIGEFGVGFKSVFGICDTVFLYSSPDRTSLSDNCYPFSVRIEDFTKPVDIAPVKIPEGYTTLFIFPYSVGFQFSGFKDKQVLNERLSHRLTNLGVTTLLFMKNLNFIEYEIKIPENETKGQYHLDKKVINDHCMILSAVEPDGKRQENSLSFLKFSMPLPQSSFKRTIDIAFMLVTEKNGKPAFSKAKNPYISVYFPTETESKLSFIVQGPFRTTPNRSSVPCDDPENTELSKKTALLYRKSILELRDMGLLDPDLIRILPIDKDIFDVYPLFYPLYETTCELFSRDRVLPLKEENGYTDARRALIARNKELTDLFSDQLITELYDDGQEHMWLPVSLTETSPYRDVFSFFTNNLGVEVVRPEDLRNHFNDNTDFIPRMSNEWLQRLYHLYEKVPNIFYEQNTRNNNLDAIMIRTASGRVVAPYRKIKDKEDGRTERYVPNVFLPSSKIYDENIEFVHPELYDKCKYFFETVLQLQVPDAYEFFIRSLERRYDSSNFNIKTEEHIQDVINAVKYLRDPSREANLRMILRKHFMLRCIQGGRQVWVKIDSRKILFPKSESGISLDLYYKDIDPDICFVDLDIYRSAGIGYSELREIGVKDDILIGTETWGQYQTGNSGRQPEWRTDGNFLWKLSIDRVEKALTYISDHPKSGDSMAKSQVIFKILQENADRLTGTVWFSGNLLPDKYNEHSEIIHILNNDGSQYKFHNWNGKWLYTESWQLVSHKEISKHDLNKTLYGKVSLDSELYDVLGFRKSQIDRYEEVVKDYDTLPDEKKRSFFAIELERRYGITPEQLNETYGESQNEKPSPSYDHYEFPAVMVKNWDALRKHAAQILSYASPVEYECVVRNIRVSKSSDDVRAYLMSMYRVDTSYLYACQLCHKPFSDVEMCQLEKKPNVELDPMYLCLCPNCASKFRDFRNNPDLLSALISKIMNLSESDLSGEDHISVTVNDFDFWFTQTHIAEITELLKLKHQADIAKKEIHGNVEADRKSHQAITDTSVIPVSNAPAFEFRMDVPKKNTSDAEKTYKEYVGKRVFHRAMKAYAKVTACDGSFITLNFESGDKAGKNIKYDLGTCLKNQWLDIAD